MAGIICDPTTTIVDAPTVTVERDGTDELLRRFVKFNGARADGSAVPVVGVCRVASTTDEEKVPVDRTGIVPVVAGAAVAQGAFLTSDASGRAITAAAGNQIHGVAALAAAAADDVIAIDLSPRGKA